MEWADIERLYRYWQESPPVHELVALAVKWKPARGREADRSERPSLQLTADEIRRGFETGSLVPIGGL